LPDWPRPSLFHTLMFENFWPGLVVLASVALVLALSGINRRSRPMLIVAAIATVLAGVNVAICYAVTTVREHTMHATGQLIDAAIQSPEDQFDVAGLTGLLAADVQMEVPAGQVFSTDRETLLGVARAANAMYQVDDWSVVQLDAMPTGESAGKAYLVLSTTIRMTGGGLLAGEPYTVPSQWLIDWRATSVGWRAERIVLTRVANNPARAGQLPRP